MKVDSVCERIKIWAERRIAQQVTLHISPEGDVRVERNTHIKDENQLQKEGVPMNETVLWEEIA